MNQDGVQALNLTHERLYKNYNAVMIISRTTGQPVGIRINIPNTSFLHEKCPEAIFVSLIIVLPENNNMIIYELALASSNGIIYNEEIGYNDVNIFQTHEAVNQELERLGLRIE